MIASVLLLGCKGSEHASDDVAGSESGSSSEASSTESETEAETETETETDTQTTADMMASSETDTDSDPLMCPIADGPGVASLVLTPELFADGADPSASEACAIVNPERGFHQFVDLRSLDADTLADAAEQGSSVVYGRVLLAEYRDARCSSGNPLGRRRVG